MTVAAHMLPPKEPVLGSLEPIERYRPIRHPDLKRLHGIATAAAERLEVIAAMRLEPMWEANLDEEDVRDGWLGFLQTMRLVHAFLRSHATLVLLRDVGRYLQHDPVAHRLEDAVSAAMKAPQTVGPHPSVDVEL